MINTDNKYIGGLARFATNAKPDKGKEKGLWTKVNTGRFIVSGYCHTDNYPLGKDHDSGSCRNPFPQHKRDSTRAKPMGSCREFNGWVT